MLLYILVLCSVTANLAVVSSRFTTAGVTKKVVEKENEVVPDLDIVFTWVNGSDPVFQASRWNHTGRREDPSVRFVNYQEIFLSVAWALHNIPWVRRVVVATCNQKFPLHYIKKQWRDKVVFVDHADFIPHYARPTFNSHTIESFLYRIPGLAEHVLYLNDDMFVDRMLTRNDIFPNGRLVAPIRQRKVFPTEVWIQKNRKRKWYYSYMNAGVLADRYAASKKTTVQKYVSHEGYFWTRSAMEKAWAVAPLELNTTTHNTEDRVYKSLSEGGDVATVVLATFIGLIDQTQELVEKPDRWFRLYQKTFGKSALQRRQFCRQRIQVASISPSFHDCLCRGVGDGLPIGSQCNFNNHKLPVSRASTPGHRGQHNSS